MVSQKQQAVIEGLLFLWGEPMPASELAEILGVPTPFIHQWCQELQTIYEQRQGGLLLQRYEDCYQLVANSQYHSYYEKLANSPQVKKLSNSAMECLAIVAYRQPITRVEIDAIRGVKSTKAMETLLEKELIEEAGRLERIGRPILYRTTLKFLQYFNISSLDELPPMDDSMLLLSEESLKEEEEVSAYENPSHREEGETTDAD